MERFNAEAFEQLLGSQLALPGNGAGLTSVRDALSEKDVVGLYFSAHWCPPCRSFTPLLAERFEKLNAAGKKLAVVFVSSDRSAEAFAEYHADMPFFALPFEDRARKAALSDKFSVKGIPTLVLLTRDGKLITDDARSAVAKDSYQEDFPYHPKPVNDLADADGVGDLSMVVLMERAAPEEQRRLTQSLEEVAVDHLDKPQRTVQHFFTGKTGGLSTRLRQVCGLPVFEDSADSDAEANKDAKEGEGECGVAAGAGAEPVMLLLKLSQKEQTVTLAKQDGPLTAGSMRDFIAAFQAGSLEAKPLQKED